MSLPARYIHVHHLDIFQQNLEALRSISGLLSRILDAYTQRTRYAERLGEDVTRARLHAESATTP
jgi:hypothetical protein